METKKGTIKSVGPLKTTSNNNTILRIIIAIGKDKAFDSRTGQQLPDRDEEIAYTLWHDYARNGEKMYGVGDIVEFDMTHYVDGRYETTVVRCDNLKMIAKAGGQQTPAGQTPTPQEKQIMDALGLTLEQARAAIQAKEQAQPQYPANCPI